MKKLVLYSTFILASQNLFSQDTMVVWENSIGGTSDETGYSIEPTSDGGFIISGNSKSGDGDMLSNLGDNDVLLTKLDAAGATVWIKNIGGSLGEEGYTVHPTSDGGYFITGYTSSSDGAIAANNGGKDLWIVKTNSLGVVQFEKAYGGTADERAFYSTQTSDGGYILVGYTTSNDGDVTANHGSGDVWVVKTDNLGNLTWEKSYGGTAGDYGYYVSETSDGGYIVTANTESNDGDVSGYNGGFSDVWVFKINSAGVLQWQNSMGGTADEYTTTVHQTVDGGYIVCAYTYSNDVDVSGNHGDYDNWIVKLNATGVIQWQKCIGGSNAEGNYSFRKTLDGKYILAGYAYSNDGDVSGLHGTTEADYWIAKIDTTGTVNWQTCLGGTGNDQAFAIAQLADSSFVVSGLSASTDGDITAHDGADDCWVVHIGPAPLVTSSENNLTSNDFENPVSIYPNPSIGTFKLTHLRLNDKVEIFNVTGEKILEQEAESETEKIDLSNQAKGIYFFKVSSQSGVKTGKIVLK